jgi:hypothetical protein
MVGAVMSSEIRQLLARAQEAEVRGERAEASRLLRDAAEYYRDRQMSARSLQMLRHARRVEGSLADDDAPLTGFSPQALIDGTEAFDEPTALELAPTPEIRAALDEAEETVSLDEQKVQRGPALADPAVDAWCSFCCRPRGEVGPLVSGPTHAFICSACVDAAGRLMGHAPTVVRAPSPSSPPAFAAPAVPTAELPAQRRARERWLARRPRITLVLGPEGAGKSRLLEGLGQSFRAVPERHEGDTLLLDLSHPLSAEEEGRVLTWLEALPRRRAVLAARGDAPTPVLVLEGEEGPEPIYDTDALHRALGARLSPRLLSLVDAVFPLEAPDDVALAELAAGLLLARGAQVPAAVVARLVAHARRSGRGAHELTALISRVPAGQWRAT